MGLDNGIVVQFNIEKMCGYQALPTKVFNLSKYVGCVQTEFSKEARSDVPTSPFIRCELVYWRRWWGVRNEVLRSLGIGDEPYKIPLTTENLKDIIDILKYFRDPKHWEEESGNYWEYKEDNIKDKIDIDIYVIEELIKTMNEYYELIDNEIMFVYFYDSY